MLPLSGLLWGVTLPGTVPLSRIRLWSVRKKLVSVNPAWDNAAIQISLFGGSEMEDWKRELDELLKRERQQREERERGLQQRKNATEQNRKKAIEFIKATVLPAFKELEKGFQERDMYVHSQIDDKTGTSMSIEVRRQGEGVTEPMQFQYEIDVVHDASRIVPEGVIAGVRHRIKTADHELSIDEITKEDVIRDFMEAYKGTFSFWHKR